MNLEKKFSELAFLLNFKMFNQFFCYGSNEFLVSLIKLLSGVTGMVLSGSHWRSTFLTGDQKMQI